MARPQVCARHATGDKEGMSHPDATLTVDTYRRAINTRSCIAIELRCIPEVPTGFPKGIDWTVPYWCISIATETGTYTCSGLPHILKRMLRSKDCTKVYYGPEVELDLSGAENFQRCFDLQDLAWHHHGIESSHANEPPSLADSEEHFCLDCDTTLDGDCPACSAERILRLAVVLGF